MEKKNRFPKLPTPSRNTRRQGRFCHDEDLLAGSYLSDRTAKLQSMSSTEKRGKSAVRISPWPVQKVEAACSKAARQAPSKARFGAICFGQSPAPLDRLEYGLPLLCLPLLCLPLQCLPTQCLPTLWLWPSELLVPLIPNFSFLYPNRIRIETPYDQDQTNFNFGRETKRYIHPKFAPVVTLIRNLNCLCGFASVIDQLIVGKRSLLFPLGRTEF